MSLTSYSPADLAKLPRWEKVALLNRLEGKQLITGIAVESAADLRVYRNDPLGFAREVLGVEPWERQQAIMQAVAEFDRVTVRSCNGAGKTLVASWICLWFLYSRPNSIVVTTAPTAYQVENLLWRRLRGAFAEARVALPGRCMTKRLECGTEWYAIGMATDEEVKFQGPHSPAGVLMVGDEASGLKEWVFTAMDGTMTEEEAKMLLIGNPNQAMGRFYESHRSWPSAQRFHISAFDVPETIIRRSWIEDMRRDLGEESPVYQVRVLGEFPPMGDDTLISLKWAEEAQARDGDVDLPAQGEDHRATVEIGVDIARYGSDESVAYARRGSVVVGAEYWRGSDLMASAGRVAAMARRVGAATLKIDDNGVGGGVTDALLSTFRGTDVTVIGLNVGEAALDTEKYYLKRSEIFWGLRERFRLGEISIPKDDQILVDQLTQLRYSYTPRGQIKLESKDDMRKNRPSSSRWQSPDRADALALAFAFGGARYIPASPPGPVFEPKQWW